MSGSLDGPLADYTKARFVLENLSLKKFSGLVNFEKEGVAKIRGPVSADVQARGEYSGGQMRSAEGRGFVNLSEAALVIGPLRKENKSNFRVKFGVRNKGNPSLSMNWNWQVLSAT